MGDYKTVGSFDALRRGGGAAMASDFAPGHNPTSPEIYARNEAHQWMSEHYDDYPNAQQLAQAASTKYDIAVAHIMPAARQFYDARDERQHIQQFSFSRWLIVMKGVTPNYFERMPAERQKVLEHEYEEYAKVDRSKDEMEVEEGEPLGDAAETPEARARRQQGVGEFMPMKPSQPLRPDQDALLSPEETRAQLLGEHRKEENRKNKIVTLAGHHEFARELPKETKVRPELSTPTFRANT